MRKRVIERFAPFLRDIAEFKQIGAAEQQEIDITMKMLENTFNDQFIADATEAGIVRHEKIYKITPKATDSLDDRRFRVLAKIKEQLPYTYRVLENNLLSLCGEGNYDMTLRSDEYRLVIRMEMVAKSQISSVSELLEKIVPANMIIDLSLKYNRNSDFNGYRHSELAASTHYVLRNEVSNGN